MDRDTAELRNDRPLLVRHGLAGRLQHRLVEGDIGVEGGICAERPNCCGVSGILALSLCHGGSKQDRRGEQGGGHNSGDMSTNA